jgi:hypothetical protein
MRACAHVSMRACYCAASNPSMLFYEGRIDGAFGDIVELDDRLDSEGVSVAMRSGTRRVEKLRGIMQPRDNTERCMQNLISWLQSQSR